MNQLIDKLALPLGIGLIITLLIGAYVLINRTSETSLASAESQELVVDVAGAVSQPGVYRFTIGAIVEDAIIAAGGLTTLADLDLVAKTVNRAAQLNNHDKLYIPTTALTAEPLATVATSHLININTASSALLETLPGIGPVTAGRIIDYREQHGPFRNVNNITQVEGISTSKFEAIKSLITI